MCRQIIRQRGGVPLKRIFTQFVQKLKGLSPAVLSSSLGVAVVPWCSYGKHRSGGGSAIMIYVMYED
jgi:hypothetical protein